MPRKVLSNSHTWLAGIKLSYQKLWLILWRWTSQVPVKQSMALGNLSEEVVRNWFDLFRTHFRKCRGLECIFQMEEVYFKRLSLLMGKQQRIRKLAYEILPDLFRGISLWTFCKITYNPKANCGLTGLPFIRQFKTGGQ